MSAPKRVKAIRKKRQHFVAGIFAPVCAVLLTLLLNGCADAYYANRAPEARSNTYYAPYYYPYYPWYAYYGGAYYYGE